VVTYLWKSFLFSLHQFRKTRCRQQRATNFLPRRSRSWVRVGASFYCICICVVNDCVSSRRVGSHSRWERASELRVFQNCLNGQAESFVAHKPFVPLPLRRTFTTMISTCLVSFQPSDDMSICSLSETFTDFYEDETPWSHEK
jgi:hypothetical protein